MAKTKVLDGELGRNVREMAIIEDRWHVIGDAAPVIKPPIDYDYVKERMRLNVCTKSLSGASRARPCCPRQKPRQGLSWVEAPPDSRLCAGPTEFMVGTGARPL
ncbi:MAG TPA: hypothetical protein VLZ74_15715 [Methylocella sp.]|nr:hypothetical protein [Methylocella sp.]